MLKDAFSSILIRFDDEDDEIMVSDQAVEKLVIVTQVRWHLFASCLLI